LIVVERIDVLVIIRLKPVLPVEVRILGFGEEPSHVNGLKLVILHLSIHFKMLL
jgi:hypothetical protein